MINLAQRIESGEFTLIAEIGVNYYDIAAQRKISPLEAAKLMVRKAKEAGVHAVKFQTYKAERLAVAQSPSYWDISEEPTSSQRKLFAKYDSFGKAEYGSLAEFCMKEGVAFCSTAFDFESADYLEPLMDVYKVSSSDLTNLPFIEYQARKGKPIIMSVGAAELAEMHAAVETVRKVNDQPLVLCHCVLEYPTPYQHANLKRIVSLREKFPDLIIGYSDHCKPDANADVIKTAYTLGARVVEKHFTLDKSLPGNDHYHAMDPDDARRIVESIAFVERIMGRGQIDYNEAEAVARTNARRSIVSDRNIAAGEVVVSDMLTFKRPGSGISPSHIDEVIGRVAACNIPTDTVLQKEMLR